MRRKQAATVNIDLPPAGVSKPPIRLNALPVTKLPTQCQRLVFAHDPDWKALKGMQRASKGALILTKTDGVWCWGSAQDARRFCRSVSAIEHQEFGERLPKISSNLQLKGFLEEALAKALAKDKPLLVRPQGGRWFLIADARASDQSTMADLRAVVRDTNGSVAGLIAPADEFHETAEQVEWAEALRISLEEKGGRYWLIINPDIWIWPARARRLATDFINERRKDRLNKKYYALLGAWISLALGKSNDRLPVAISAFPGAASPENPAFEVSPDPAASLGRPS